MAPTSGHGHRVPPTPTGGLGGDTLILSNMSSYIHWYALHALLNYVHNCYVLCWIDDMRCFLDNNLDKCGDMVVKVLVDALERQLS